MFNVTAGVPQYNWEIVVRSSWAASSNYYFTAQWQCDAYYTYCDGTSGMFFAAIIILQF